MHGLREQLPDFYIPEKNDLHFDISHSTKSQKFNNAL